MVDDLPRKARTLSGYWRDIRCARIRQQRAALDGDEEAAGEYEIEAAGLQIELSKIERVTFRRDENQKRRKGN